MQNQKRNDGYKNGSDPLLNSLAYRASQSRFYLQYVAFIPMPVLDTEEGWLLSVQMEYREDGHRAKQSVSPVLNYPLIHHRTCFYSTQSAPAVVSTQGLNSHLIEEGCRALLQLFSSYFFPEAAIITVSAIHWVMEEVRKVYTSKTSQVLLINGAYL